MKPTAADYLVQPGKKYSSTEADAILTAPGFPLEMDNVEIRGSTYRVYKNSVPNMRFVLMVSRIHGDDVHVVLNEERITFEQHYTRVANVAHALLASGVKKGDRVGVLTRNFPEWLFTFWATVAIGAVIVPINAWLKTAELEHILVDSGVKILLVDTERAHMLLSRDKENGNSNLLERVRSSNGTRGAPEKVVVAKWMEEAKMGRRPLDEKVFEKFGGVRGLISFEDFVEGISGVEDKDELPDVDIHPDDDATLLYTSGTTGKPKGALGTHRNYTSILTSASALMLRERMMNGEGLLPMAPPSPRDRATKAQEAFLMGIPFFHVTATHAFLGPLLAAGIKLVLMPKWDAGHALKLIQAERITMTGGVPALVWQIMEHPDVDKYDISSLTKVSYGGAPAAKELIPTINKKVPKAGARNSYGLTETSSVAISNSGIEYIERPDSIGRAIQIVDVRIVEPGNFNKVLPPNAVGEIALRGPTIVKGYYNNPTATAKSFSPDGWFLTGDVGRMDEDGFVYLMDRAKDMLIRGGENIYCVEVEDCLYSHPAVMDCGIVGLPHRVLGEEVAAVVQVKPAYIGKITPENLIQHCKSKLAHFKVPVFVDIRNEPLPRNPNGKILKNQLREEVVALHKSVNGGSGKGSNVGAQVAQVAKAKL
ncbi:hypothetical protein HDU76_002346 [Blyttiomyces sp. JEL0837]|nr:hypothetical protein HDU76_002346 [Blyttiomyces sp. JEL0837]